VDECKPLLTGLVTYVVPGRRLPTMVPAFDPSVFTYHVNITFDDTDVIVVPAAADPLHRQAGWSLRTSTRRTLNLLLLLLLFVRVFV